MSDYLDVKSFLDFFVAELGIDLTAELDLMTVPAVRIEDVATPAAELAFALLTADRIPTAENRELLIRRLNQVAVLAACGRRTTNLRNQELADILEIRLIQAFNQSKRSDLLSIADIPLVIRLVSDFDYRQRQRFAAVLVAHAEAMDSLARNLSAYSDGDMGLYSLGDSLGQWWLGDLNVQIINLTGNLLDMIEAGRRGQPVLAELHRIERLFPGGRLLKSRSSRVDDLRMRSLEDPIELPEWGPIPGFQWFAPWEDAGKKMAADDQVQNEAAE